MSRDATTAGRGRDRSVRSAAAPSTRASPAEGEEASPTRTLVTFVVTVAAWVVGLYGLFRLPLVQQYGLVPFARIQQGIAVALFGVSPTAIIVDVSCTGSDAMALALGAVLGFPAPWKQRIRAAGVGFLLITALNTLRIATLSMVVGERATFDLLHLYVWPGLIVLAAVLYVFRWMQSVTPGGPVPSSSLEPGNGTDRSLASAGASSPSSSSAEEERAIRPGAWGIAASSGWRFGITASVLVTGYFVASPWILGSATLQTVSVWSAGVARTLMAGVGVTASVNGNLLMAGSRAWLITPECIVTPLIPVYLATIMCWPTTARRRWLALACAPLLFFSLGVVRLLVLALPASLAVHTVALHAFYQIALALLLVAFAVRFARGSREDSAGWHWPRAASAIVLGTAAAAAYAAAIAAVVSPVADLIGRALPHLGHGYSDAQGALMILPAFQLGLFVALWVAAGEGLRSARVAAAAAVLAIQQSVVVLVLGELQTHAGFELPIVAIRAGAILVPVALVWLLRQDRSMWGALLPTPGAVLSS